MAKSWSDANTTCSSWCASAHLAVVNSESEAYFVRGRLPGKDLWLGCTADEAGQWQCSGASDASYDTETGFHGQVGYWRKYCTILIRNNFTTNVATSMRTL